MDYKEKYEKVLENAKAFLKRWECVEEANSYLVLKEVKDIFPELKESEDERIKNDIRGLIEFAIEDGSAIAPGRNTTKEEALAWLEKQVEKPQGKTAMEAIKEEKVDNANKIKPKFNGGDWVVQENIGVYKVIEVCESWYEVIDFEDNHYSISFDKECMCHLWTIQDAKPGDILALDNEIFIYAHRRGMYPIVVAHCFTDNVIDFCLGGEFGYVERASSISPATKEQRDLLFQKMHEAGYEWDDEKKRFI